jgi:nifR3 family TIM-barrel protein
MQLKQIKIGNITLKNNLLLAPIAGYTDFAFRSLCVKYGAAMGFTELVSCKGLLYDNEKTKQLLYTDENEEIKGVQIFGSDPEIMRKACESEDLQKFDIVDINMGCPVSKLFKNGEGSALMTNLTLAEKIIKECEKSGKTITVKFRIGIEQDNLIAKEFAKMCEDAGAKMITIHGRVRTAYYSGDVNYKEIEKAKNAVNIPVIANGGVFEKEDADILMEKTGADGIMIARGALSKPYIFSEILHNNIKIDKKQMILSQIENMLTKFDDRYVAVNLRKMIALYIKGMVGNRQIKNEIFSCENTLELKKLIDKVF